MMEKARKILLIALLSLCLAIGISYAGLKVKEYSGFLGDYSQLKPGPKGGVAELYMKEGVDFKKYNKVMVDQVEFYFKKDAENQAIDPDEMKELADKYDRAVIDALGDAYPIVTEPGPDDMRVRAAITDLQLPNRAINVISSISPASIGISVIKKGITGKSPGVGEISMEFELLDSQSNERLAAGIDRRAGGKINSMSKLGNADDAFKFWAKRLRTRLDEFHEK
jgi:hypothetical protein